jgi:hypothetical protein
MGNLWPTNVLRSVHEVHDRNTETLRMLEVIELYVVMLSCLEFASCSC